MKKSKKTETKPITISDDTLLNKIREGNENSMFLLIKKYEHHSKRITSKYFESIPKHNGVTYEELYQVCLGAVFSAAKTFDSNKLSQFYPYWKGIAIRSMFAYYYENSYSGKCRTFAGDVSFDEGVMGSSSDNTYSDILGLTDEKMNVGLIIEENKDLIQRFHDSL